VFKIPFREWPELIAVGPKYSEFRYIAEVGETFDYDRHDGLASGYMVGFYYRICRCKAYCCQYLRTTKQAGGHHQGATSLAAILFCQEWSHDTSIRKLRDDRSDPIASLKYCPISSTVRAGRSSGWEMLGGTHQANQCCILPVVYNLRHASYDTGSRVAMYCCHMIRYTPCNYHKVSSLL
jgi:hypothetical protein